MIRPRNAAQSSLVSQNMGNYQSEMRRMDRFRICGKQLGSETVRLRHVVTNQAQKRGKQ
jgi:hypothetical protein